MAWWTENEVVVVVVKTRTLATS